MIPLAHLALPRLAFAREDMCRLKVTVYEMNILQVSRKITSFIETICLQCNVQ